LAALCADALVRGIGVGCVFVVFAFFADPRLAVLQTPQTFYNPDMVQQNLGLGGGVADEQALFFREIQPARDAWGNAFYCGSCAMLRTEAIREIGGFPT